MPKLQKKAITVDTVTHPKSRKAIKMFKESKKHAAREKSKMVTHVKNNLIGEKLMWFKERIPPDVAVCSKTFVNELLLTYLSRFDEELEQIRMKHSIGHRNKNRQHASREDVIRHTQEREKEEYNTCGLEMPNLLDGEQMKVLRNWSGELRFLQNFKLVRIGKKHLQESGTGMDCLGVTSESVKNKEADVAGVKDKENVSSNEEESMVE